jgi:glutamate formiminotransferase/formiminotetrahydrofolate cyclodeaminase
LLDSGIYYLKKQGRSWKIPIHDILETAVQSLGLSDVSEFSVEERVFGLPANLDCELGELKFVVEEIKGA